MFALSNRPIDDSLAVLSRFLIGELSIHDTLQLVSVHATRAIPGADMAGLTMLLEGRPRTAVFTDVGAPEIDQAQYDSGEGPCLDAFRDRTVNYVRDTRDDGPWLLFRKAALDHGILSTLSLPMETEERALGAMNLYSSVADGFDPSGVDIARAFAAQASIVLANTQSYWDAHDLSERLGEATRHRAVIEQAKGMLMVTQGCSADDAFDLLVRASQRENVKLREIARRMVADVANRSRKGD